MKRLKRQHSPGPWKVWIDTPITASILSKEGEPLTTVMNTSGGRKLTRKQKADANLIACAPMLLDACIEALEFIEKNTKGYVIDCKDTLRIAISKACVFDEKNPEEATDIKK